MWAWGAALPLSSQVPHPSLPPHAHRQLGRCGTPSSQGSGSSKDTLLCGALSLHTAQGAWLYLPAISSAANANTPTVPLHYFVGTEDRVYLGIVLVGKLRANRMRSKVDLTQ